MGEEVLRSIFSANSRSLDAESVKETSTSLCSFTASSGVDSDAEEHQGISELLEQYRLSSPGRDWVTVFSQIHQALQQLYDSPFIRRDPYCDRILRSILSCTDTEQLDFLSSMLSNRVTVMLGGQRERLLGGGQSGKARSSGSSAHVANCNGGTGPKQRGRVYLRF